MLASCQNTNLCLLHCLPRSADGTSHIQNILGACCCRPEPPVCPTEESLLLQISDAELVTSAKTACNAHTFALKTPCLNHNGGANPDLFLQMPNLERKVTVVSGRPLWQASKQNKRKDGQRRHTEDGVTLILPSFTQTTLLQLICHPGSPAAFLGGCCLAAEMFRSFFTQKSQVSP